MKHGSPHNTPDNAQGCNNKTENGKVRSAKGSKSR
jgi:hypothetical protein